MLLGVQSCVRSIDSLPLFPFFGSSAWLWIPRIGGSSSSFRRTDWSLQLTLWCDSTQLGSVVIEPRNTYRRGFVELVVVCVHVYASVLPGTDSQAEQVPTTELYL